jgi:acetylornithine/N-succinyldiaminopimelate aminotransferase
MNTIERDNTYVAHSYKRFQVELTHGKGSLVYDVNGKEYIDLGSGIGVTSLGLCDDVWAAAVAEQASKLQHMSNLYYTEPCTLLAEHLCERTGMKRVFFSNSGAEANECLIKAMRKYAAEKKGAEYSTIITLVNSFHGRTLTTLAATGQDHFHELFQPLTPGFISVPANDLDAMKNAVDANKVAGILIETIQGEGGVIALAEDFVRGIAKLCEENDIIFGVDEVQTGNGRTGKFYSYEHYGVKPDVVSTAKGLGGGLPLGATLLGEKVADVFGYGDHGSTFGGNPVCCAGALSIVKRIDDALLAEVTEKSNYIKSELEGAPGVESVSGRGLMLGIKTLKPASEVVAACMENGVLPLTAKEKVRLLPALNIPMDVLKRAVAVIKQACAE